MQALVHHGPDQRGWDTVPDPKIIDPTDIVVRIDTSTICGSDLYILKATCRRRSRGRCSVYRVPDHLTDEQVLFLADILPTAYEVGVLNGRVRPGDVVAIVGAGPVGLAAVLTARLYTPARIISIDLADSRLARAIEFGADTTINNGTEDAAAKVMELTGGLGADVAIEAVGVPDTFELATALIRPGGTSRTSACTADRRNCISRLWTRDVTVTTGLVDTFTIPQLMALVTDGRLDPSAFATHHFALDETMAAYDTFAAAATSDALKVVLTGAEQTGATAGKEAAGAVA
jgi:alcohol dehydrogenase